MMGLVGTLAAAGVSLVAGLGFADEADLTDLREDVPQGGPSAACRCSTEGRPTRA